jgi:hypothetical protein
MVAQRTLQVRSVPTSGELPAKAEVTWSESTWPGQIFDSGGHLFKGMQVSDLPGMACEYCVTNPGIVGSILG